MLYLPHDQIQRILQKNVRGKQDRFRRVPVYPRSLQRQQESQPGSF